MIKTDNLELALANAKVGDRLVMISNYILDGVATGVIVINQENKYNVWIEKENDFGDEDWYDNLKTLIFDYWNTWKLGGDDIQIELY